MTEQFDVVVIGAGPAGLSAALNLVRARRKVLVLDSNRPRNAATFASHGFVTRDGISPLELRRLGREELEAYEGATFAKAVVSAIEPGFVVTAGASYQASAVVIATGLTEKFPALPSLRTFYGTSIHSCVECDAYEYADAPIALIGETDDLAERALLISQWSRDLIVFTNAVGRITADEETRLAERGVSVDRRAVADVAGDRDGLSGIVLADGDVIPRSAAFVRPMYSTNLGYAASLGLATTAEGWLEIDDSGRTSVPGVYAAGDSTAPGPQQLIVAAGAGARVASAVNRDLLA
ncbi:NAD(P)/FAD-dependent oxidoreductase [Glaciihabitans arcticus]|uniref:NAD(P)/FAD-dependent oxidoreductase n=1 Tax=Glaciihabitans arcticus TaxID=2668039 RepID=A0A4Q9GQ30_9MICO|nr:NAD(P)/FAD-dependent oxidoreductase [Glaciihabitans arcticus]TBN56064.1 NAD(P)/FAD-dependent oxidoreductase [Glaciihabitans arcticus]